MRQDGLLCSINDRLAGKPGRDFEPLSGIWIEEMLDLTRLDAKYDRERKDRKGRHEPTEEEWEEWLEE